MRARATGGNFISGYNKKVSEGEFKMFRVTIENQVSEAQKK